MFHNIQTLEKSRRLANQCESHEQIIRTKLPDPALRNDPQNHNQNRDRCKAPYIPEQLWTSIISRISG